MSRQSDIDHIRFDLSSCPRKLLRIKILSELSRWMFSRTGAHHTSWWTTMLSVLTHHKRSHTGNQENTGSLGSFRRTCRDLTSWFQLHSHHRAYILQVNCKGFSGQFCFSPTDMQHKCLQVRMAAWIFTRKQTAIVYFESAWNEAHLWQCCLHLQLLLWLISSNPTLLLRFRI